MISNKTKLTPEQAFVKYGNYIKFAGVALLVMSLPEILRSVLNLYASYMILESDPALLNEAALETYNAMHPYRTLIWCSSILYIPYSLLESAAGICGLCFHGRPDKANLCIILGSLTIACMAGFELCSLLAGQSLDVTLILPLSVLFFYLLGAAKLKKMNL